MPRIFQDRYIIEISINGQPVNWQEFAIEELSIHESVKQRFPTAELSFACGPTYILNNPILDASPVVITIEDIQINPPSPSLTYKMRAFNSKFKTVGNLFKWYASLYLDAADLHQAKIKSYGKTTSSNAIASAARDAGLQPDCDPSSDVQYWLRRNVRGADFIYKTAKHSHAGPMSCFVTGITGQHKLRHYNITEKMSSAHTWTFTNKLEKEHHPGGNEILYEHGDYGTVSGTTNSYAGYGQTSGSYHLEKGFQDIKADVAKISSGFLNMGRAMLGSQRAQTLPFDSDNTHENYTKAGQQNKAIKSLFSTKVTVRTRFGRHVELLDYVNLYPYAPGLNEISGGLILPWAGNYFVSEIHTLVTPALVAKEYVLLREGLDIKGGADFGLMGGE